MGSIKTIYKRVEIDGFDKLLKEVRYCATIDYDKPFIKAIPFNHNKWNDFKEVL
jgi:methenyltetrahydromethanopterin cyclohydrolase